MKTYIKRNTIKTTGLVALTLATSGAASIAQAATTVQLNGQPLATSVAPLRQNGRTLVPMRDIFEALGATVTWNALTRGITASKGTKTINLQIGNRTSTISDNASTVRTTLDQAPVIYRKSTLVPLRFVSEALGAQVNWNNSLQLVDISTATVTGSGTDVAGTIAITVPAGAVVPVTLDTELTSANARRGETFTATVYTANPQDPGDSEFPPGSRLEGVVQEVTPKDDDNPGMLDLTFRSVTLPDGTRQNIRGSLISLDNDSVSTTEGRVVARNDSKKDTTKTVIIGAGAGFLLGKLLKKNSVVTALLGAAGGFLYDRQKDKNRRAEAVLPAGTKFGVRLDSPVTYTDATYAPRRAEFLKSS